MSESLADTHPSLELLRRFGELRGPEAAAIRGHLDSCAVCSQVLKDQTQPPHPGRDLPPLPPREATEVIPPGAAEPRERTADLPERVGRYRLECEIARGGMGQVVRVTDEAFQRPLAMKIALSASTADSAQAGEDNVDRFVREAQVTGQLQHPGIPPVQEMGMLADGRPYFIMKLIEGSDLKDLLRNRSLADRTTGADLPRFVAIFGQICQTLGYAHSHGIIHRDLKPANIMVGAFGEVQVMDWGLAKLVGKAAAEGERGRQGDKETGISVSPTLPVSLSGSALPQETAPGTVMGTSAFMAPEQARGEVDTLDARCDVFGLGGILCEILTGAPPFAEDTTMKNIFLAMLGDLSGTLVRLDACGADAELVALAKRCLAADRKDRPAHGGIVAEAVSQYQAALQERTKQAEIDKAAALVKMREERKRRRVSLALAAAVVLLIVGSSAGLLWYQREMARQDADKRQQAEDKRTQDARLAEDKRLRDAKQAEDQRQRDADLAVRRQYLNKEIKAAVFETELRRKDLLTKLADQSMLNVWLSDIDQWQRALNDAHVAWLRASTAAAGSPDLVEAALAERVRKLKDDLAADEAGWKFGKACDDARLAAVTMVEGTWDPRAAGQRYPGIFMDAHLDVLNEEPNSIVARIKESPIRLVYLAALDNWMNFAVMKPEHFTRLSAIANELDTDPWRKELRNEVVRSDKAKLRALADRVDLHGQSPQILVALGMLLEARFPQAGQGANLLRQAREHHPRDFWIIFVLGDLAKDPVEREGCFRSALIIRDRSSPVHNNLGNALHAKKDVNGAIFHYREALKINPNLAQAHGNLANMLRDRKDMKGAIEHYGKAFGINPNDDNALVGIGNAQLASRDWDGAIKHYRLAVKINPDNAAAHNNLAIALRVIKDVPGAIKHFREALRINPNNVPAHGDLGTMLREIRQVDEAIAHYRLAVKIDPHDPRARNNLAAALLYDKKEVPEAIEQYRKALEIKPDYANARQHLAVAYAELGPILLAKGQMSEARSAVQECLKLVPAGHPLRKTALQQLQRCDQLLALDKQLSAILQGQDPPNNAAGLLTLADLCLHYKHHYAAAARFYAGALEKDPTLAHDLQKELRCSAARAASLAAAGKGKDADKLQSKDIIKLRQRALDWLQADLADWRKQSQAGGVDTALLLIQRLILWQNDPALAGVRDAKELAGLPRAEQEQCQQLWADLAQLLKETKARFIETRTQGTLTAKQIEQVHTAKMDVGKSYVIDLESTQFDAFLRLTDAAGKVLAENDDISATDQNSHLIFLARQTGVYRVIATSFEQRGTGAYVLTIREFTGPAVTKEP